MVGVNIQVVVLGALPHAVQRAFDHFGNGGNLDARVRAKDRDGLFPLFGRYGQDGIVN
jgi:hypothetical protein